MAGYIGSKSSVTQVDGYNQAEADAEFVNDPNGAITVDGSNNVGIGTSSPSSLLHVNGDISVGNNGEINNTQGESIELSNLSDAIFFRTASTERMRIDDSGNLILNKTTATDAGVGILLNAQNGRGFFTTSNDYCAQFRRLGNTGPAVYFLTDETVVGTISLTGSSTSYNTSSDYRLKTDAQPMVGASARVQALNPVNFEWIADGTRVDGFLAHEAQAVVPECATGTKDAMRDEEYEVTAAIEATYDDDGNELTAAVDAVMGTRNVPDYQGIDQSKLVPLLTAALQEALNKIDTMETRLAALEGN